ncbi:MAG: hypothetical protein IJE09_00440 [Oscillospiraceae bacterium]|nr:hypothetical protein [Oscillospiraceae bacterium]
MKKIVFVILVLALCLCCAACGGEEAPAATPVPTVEPTVEPSPEPTPEPTPTPPVLENFDLSGNWQGTWEVFGCTGAWAQMEGFGWDAFAEIGEDSILLWDADIPKETGLAQFKLEDAEPIERIVEGRFMDNQINPEDYSMKLELDEEGRLLTIRGNYVSERNGSFSLVVYLREQK